MSIELRHGHLAEHPAIPDVALFRMPGGEWHIDSKRRLAHEEWAFVRWERGDELMALAVWADAVHRDGGSPRAVIPYLPGARQDRRTAGEALTAKVYANIINTCRLKNVICLDPHSDVAPALLDTCTVVAATPFIAKALGVRHAQVVGIIAPDAGAYKRAERIASRMAVPLFQATKVRDKKTGRLSDFRCEALPPEGVLMVVDDICDGGGTFKGLARATGLPRERAWLWVTHGVFSSGSEDLYKFYSRIMTTDSHGGVLHAIDSSSKIEVLQVFGPLVNIVVDTVDSMER